MAAAATETNGNGATKALDEKLAAASLQTPPATGNGAAEADEEADDDDDAEAEGGGADGGASKKKKKKRSGAAKRKAKAAASGGAGGEAAVQSEPPRVPVSKMFPSGNYPVGEEQQYDPAKFLDENRRREPLAETKERERQQSREEGNDYNLIRQAAEVHRQVRQYAQATIKPGMTMTEIAEIVEDGTRALVEAEGFESGIGFPTGLSLNEVAAHYTPNAGDKRVLQKGDVLKVDFGVHRKGRIVDSAFTLTFDEDKTWQPLLDAVRAATNTGIRESGIDARLQDIGEAIQETMESHEFEVNGKLHKVKCVRNLQGHNINPYSIHGGKSVPIVKVPNLDVRMDEGEYFAIETFGTTGQGYVTESGDCSHYARKLHAPHVPLRVASARPLLYTINKNFGSLPWCRRYLDRLGEKNYLLGLKHLVSQGVVQDYPPLADVHGSMTAQFEHTILLRPTCKEVVSRGEDY